MLLFEEEELLEESLAIIGDVSGVSGVGRVGVVMCLVEVGGLEERVDGLDNVESRPWAVVVDETGTGEGFVGDSWVLKVVFG